MTGNGGVFLDTEGLMDIIEKRRNHKVFKKDPVRARDLEAILEAARWAPSPGNVQPWELVVVREADRKKRIAEIHAASMSSPGKPKEIPTVYTDPPVLVAICIDTRIKDGFPESFSREFLTYAGVGALMENMWLAAASLGLGMGTGTQPVSAQKDLQSFFGLPGHYEVPEIVQIGYPKKALGKTSRKKLEEFVHWES